MNQYTYFLLYFDGCFNLELMQDYTWPRSSFQSKQSYDKAVAGDGPVEQDMQGKGSKTANAVDKVTKFESFA